MYILIHLHVAGQCKSGQIVSLPKMPHLFKTTCNKKFNIPERNLQNVTQKTLLFCLFATTDLFTSFSLLYQMKLPFYVHGPPSLNC